MMGHRAHLRRRVEGGDAPPARCRRSTTTAGSCTTSTVDRSECNDLAATRARDGSRSSSTCGGARPRSTACCRSTTAPSSCSARASATVRRTRRTATTRTGPPMSPLPAQVGASIGGRSWDLDATIDRPAGAGGVLYATGTENSGLSVFVQDDRLVFDYNCFGDHHVVDVEREVPVGASVVGVRFRRTGKAGTRHARDRRRRVRHGRHPVRDADDLERRPERRLRPRLAGQPALRRRLPVRGPPRAGRHPADLRAARRRGRPRGGRARAPTMARQ